MLTKEEEETAEMKYAIRQFLDEMEDECIEINETELEQRVAELCNAFGVNTPSTKPKKHKPHTCKQCGAPLKDVKCDYCGTEY